MLIIEKEGGFILKKRYRYSNNCSGLYYNYLNQIITRGYNKNPIGNMAWLIVEKRKNIGFYLEEKI